MLEAQKAVNPETVREVAALIQARLTPGVPLTLEALEEATLAVMAVLAPAAMEAALAPEGAGAKRGQCRSAARPRRAGSAGDDGPS